MELTQESLLKVFGESAEMCAGSIVAVVDGVKQEVASCDLHTGTYKLSKHGEAAVKGVAKEDVAPAQPTGISSKKKKNEAPVESLPLPGVDAEPLTAGDEVAKALAGLDLAE